MVVYTSKDLSNKVMPRVLQRGTKKKMKNSFLIFHNLLREEMCSASRAETKCSPLELLWLYL